MSTSHRPSPSRRRLVLLLVPAALLLAACGSDATPAPAAAPTTAATSAAPATPAAPAATTTPAAAAPTTSPAPPSPTEAGPPRCRTTALTGSLRAGDAGAGQRSATLVLTNRSGRPCRLDGYGGIQLTGPSGPALPTRQVRDPGTPPRAVTLAPGAAGASLLRWTAVPGAGPCPAPGTLRVIPPDERSALSVRWDLGPVCGGGRISQGAYRSASEGGS